MNYFPVHTICFKTKHSYVLKGSLLKSKAPELGPRGLRLFISYFTSPLRNVEFTYEIDENYQRAWTNDVGEFEIHCDSDCKTIRLNDLTIDLTSALDLSNQPTLIISDIDDTLIYSESHSIFRRTYLALFKGAKKRKAIDQSLMLIKHLKTKSPDSKLLYLSRSELNLSFVLQKIFDIHKVPYGLFLLSFWQDVTTLFKKGLKEDHKLNWLEFLLENGNPKLYLIGDNSQFDPIIYQEIQKKFPKQILGTFIHLKDSKATSSKFPIFNYIDSRALDFGEIDQYIVNVQNTYRS